MLVIGLSGEAGSGKDTAYEQLRIRLEKYGLSCTKLSFASKLKDICTLMFGWDRKRIESDFAYKEGDTLDDGSPDPACEMLGKTRRVVMQELGTEAMRQGLHSDAWIIALKLAIQRGEYDKYDVGFITDCRFMNEIEFIRDMDGLMYQIVGDGTNQTGGSQHESELQWKAYQDWDAVIPNRIDPNLSKEENLKRLQDRMFEQFQTARPWMLSESHLFVRDYLGINALDAMRRDMAEINDMLDSSNRSIDRISSSLDRAEKALDKKEKSFDMVAHLRDQWAFGEKAFGPISHNNHLGPLQHLRKELVEIEADPDDVTEWADGLLLLCDGAMRAGHTPEQIVKALADKLALNKTRTWPDWRESKPNSAIEHVREEA